jgi:c(7)-type cytochrome triheme protein
MTIPSGGDAHATCYQCHTADKVMGEKNLGSCSTCHQPGTPTQIADSTKAPGFGFDHNRHSGLSCTSCHNSTGGNNMSAPTVAMHTSAGSAQSCATCHNGSRAFGANTFANCKSCHQQFAGARSFGVKFEHSDHAKANCATCHKSAGKGVSFSVPAGQNAHTTCFQCHSPTKQGTSQNNGYCFQCHQPGSGERMAAAPMFIAGNFSHTKHKAMACNSCHSTKGGDISAPTVAMHKTAKGTQSCATCHNNQKAFGEDFSNCKRCHTGENFKFTGK